MIAKELESLAERKGFYLVEVGEQDELDEEARAAQFILEGIDDDPDEPFIYFKTEDGLRRFLDALPDAVPSP